MIPPELQGGSTLRVGSVPYLVARPLNFGLEAEPNIDLSFDVPARLIERLRSGELDVALVSSIELFRRPGYSYLAGLAVSGKGYVGSVQLFLKKPLAEVRTIALDPASRTAQALVQVLAHIDPELPSDLNFTEVPLGQDPRATDCDAWLRIGDPAMFELLGESIPYYNPSEAWARITGLPFVFAAWIVRPGLSATDLAPQLSAFHSAAKRGASRATAMAEAAAADWGLPPAEIVSYLTEECQHTIDPSVQARAIELFGAHAKRHGLATESDPPAAIHRCD